MFKSALVLNLIKFLGRGSSILPKVYVHKGDDGYRRFYFALSYCHYTTQNIIAMNKGEREPALYKWLSALPADAVLFDIGTSFGQESVWIAPFTEERRLTMVGFDVSLLQGHFCALNNLINGNHLSAGVRRAGGTRRRAYRHSDELGYLSAAVSQQRTRVMITRCCH